MWYRGNWLVTADCTSARMTHGKWSWASPWPPLARVSGFATEALGSVLEYVFGTLGKHRVFAVTDAENRAAASLFRKLGFRQEGHFVEHVWFKGAWGSEYLFVLKPGVAKYLALETITKRPLARCAGHWSLHKPL